MGTSINCQKPGLLHGGSKWIDAGRCELIFIPCRRGVGGQADVERVF